MTTAPTLDKLVLGHGSHKPPAGGIGGDAPVVACINEALAIKWAIDNGLDVASAWTDNLACVDPVIRGALMSCNDRYGTGQAADERRKRVLGPLYEDGVGLGTKGSRALSRRRAWALADWSIRFATPKLLRLTSLADRAATLEGMPEITSDASLLSARALLLQLRDDAWAAHSAAWKRIGQKYEVSAAEAAAVEAVAAVAEAAAEAEAAAVEAAEAVAAVAEAVAEAAVAEAVVAEAVAEAAVAEAAAAAAAVADPGRFAPILAAAQNAYAETGSYWSARAAARRVIDETGYVSGIRPKFAALRDELDADFAIQIRKCAAMTETT